MTDLEKGFDNAIHEIYHRAKEEYSYNVKSFSIMLKTAIDRSKTPCQPSP